MKTFAWKHKTTGQIVQKISLPSSCDDYASQLATVGHILRGPCPQAKVRMGVPDGVYEREAEQVADEVLRRPNPAQRIETLQSFAPPSIQGKGAGEIPGTEQVPPIVTDVLSSPGQPLGPSTRSFFEPRFGHDFKRVQVHVDARAKASAQAVDALAYTVGSHIVLGEGRDASETMAGKRLLAHELTHVVRQTATRGAAESTLHRSKKDKGQNEPDPAEIVRLVDEMTKLAQRNAWTGVNRIYNSIESMGEGAFDAAGNAAGIHRLGAEAARNLGEIERYQTLLLRTKTALDTDIGHIDDKALQAVLQDLSGIEETYGVVRIAPRSEPKSKGEKKKLQGPELVPAEWPFEASVRKSIEIVRDTVLETGYFSGLIPARAYTLGDYTFTVQAGTETSDAKTLSILWGE